MKIIKIKDIEISNNHPLVFILGPCVIEGRDHTLKIAELINSICEQTSTKYIFKSSFDKANRTNISSKRGVGLDEGLKIFEEIKKNFNCPILTDVHNEIQCNKLIDNSVIDVIQIPAFLSRQTDLLISAAKTNKVINVKKGQFLSPYEIPNIIEKIKSNNNDNILITERGTSFGYNNLVNDFKGLEIMKGFQYPIIFDATHSVQEPGGTGTSSGGKREFIPTLSKAAAAIGVAGIFIETHEDPQHAPSDGPNMLDIKNLRNLLVKLKNFDDLAKKS